jgi:serine/threonine-protein kinase
MTQDSYFTKDKNNFVLFKAFSSGKNQNGHYSADKVWIHDSGLMAAIIDGVSSCKDPVKASETCINIINRLNNESGKGLLEEPLEEIINKIHESLRQTADDLFAVILIIREKGKDMECSWVGNPNLFKISDNQITPLEEIQSQPLQVIGTNVNINPRTLSFEIEKDITYLFSSDGIDIKKLKEIHKNKYLLNISTEKEWNEVGSKSSSEIDWSFVLYPYDSVLSFIDPSWPYNPFVGHQEEYPHEKEGLAIIASILFKNTDFNGFKIVGSRPRINKNNLTRRFDGILVCPYGIFLLELKHYNGDIILDFDKGKMIRIKYVNKIEEYNPVDKIADILNIFTTKTDFGELNFIRNNCNGISAKLLDRKKLPQKMKSGMFIFTHPHSTVKCIKEGQEYPLPYKAGDILIVTPSNIPEILKRNLNNVDKLTPEEIDIICSNLNNAYFKHSFIGDSNHQTYKTIGDRFKYKLDSEIISAAGFIKTYKGSYIEKDRPVIIKEYSLTTMAKLDPDNESKRLEREIAALQDLKYIKGNMQDYIDHFCEGDFLYTILENIEGPTLEEWVLANPPTGTRLKILRGLAEILYNLSKENITHRAITPYNIIVATANNEPYLTNFEICHLEYLQTIAPVGRRLIDINYQPREVNTPGDIVTPAADTYSFGKIICFVLSKDHSLPFNSYMEQAKFVQKANSWDNLAMQLGLKQEAGKHIKDILSPNPAQRPTGEALINIIENWMVSSDYK